MVYITLVYPARESVQILNVVTILTYLASYYVYVIFIGAMLLLMLLPKHFCFLFRSPSKLDWIDEPVHEEICFSRANCILWDIIYLIKKDEQIIRFKLPP